VDVLHVPRDLFLHDFCFARRHYLHLVLVHCEAERVRIYQIKRQEEDHSQHDDALKCTVVAWKVAHQCLYTTVWLRPLQNLSLHILQNLHLCYAEDYTQTHRKS
jgi:hypothetical protein